MTKNRPPLGLVTLALVMAMSLLGACGDDDSVGGTTTAPEIESTTTEAPATTPASTEVVTEVVTEIQILDSAGRVVTLDGPAESVVILWSNPAEEIRSLGAIERIIGFDQSTQSKIDQGLYPELTGGTLVGTYDEPDYEKIAGLDPDVVIMLSIYSPYPSEVAEILAPFGIEVVALDFFSVETYEQEVRTLGMVLGLQDEAEDYLGFFAEMNAEIAARLEGIDDSARPRVYFEGATSVYQTYGGAGYGHGMPGLIRAAGGIDIFPEVVVQSFEADPEEVAARQPDVILKGDRGGYFLEDTSVFEALYDEITGRPELATTPAILNGRVNVISFDVSGGARKKFGTAFIAPILYPERFEGFDPLAYLERYLVEYQGLDFQGVYVYPSLDTD